MLTLLKLLKKLWGTLNGDATPLACAVAVFIGCTVGLTPAGPQTVLLLLLVLVFRIPVSVTLLASGVLKLIDVLFFKSVAAWIGAAMLAEGTITRKLVVWLLDIPVVGLVPLERHGVLGGMVVGVLLGLALWYPVMAGIRGYRRALKEKVVSNKWYQKMSKFSWLFGGALKGGKLAS